MCEGFTSCAFQHRTLPHFLFAQLLACVLNTCIRGAQGSARRPTDIFSRGRCFGDFEDGYSSNASFLPNIPVSGPATIPGSAFTFGIVKALLLDHLHNVFFISLFWKWFLNVTVELLFMLSLPFSTLSESDC